MGSSFLFKKGKLTDFGPRVFDKCQKPIRKKRAADRGCSPPNKFDDTV
jgi:hypothetical protein